MRRICLLSLMVALLLVPGVGAGKKEAPPTGLFTVSCRNGAVVPWVSGKVATARVCALELVGLWKAGRLVPAVCDEKARTQLSDRFFKEGRKFELIGAGSRGHFEVLGVEDGRENPGCGLVAWGKDEVERPLSRYMAVLRKDDEVRVTSVPRELLPSEGVTVRGDSWLERRGVPSGDRTPLQISQSVRLTLPGGEVEVLEAQAGMPDDSGRFPAEGLLITESGASVVDAVVHPSRNLKTTRLYFLDAFDVAADARTEILLFEQYRDGTGDYLVLSRQPKGWQVLLRTGQLDRRRYRGGLRGSVFDG